MVNKRPTIKDIAKLANVSPTAVSMALNNRPRIGEETRKRILLIAKKLSYQPNFVARSLVVQKSQTIGVLIANIMDPFYAELAKGIEDKCLELGYNMILCSTNNDLRLERYYLNILQSKRVDGIILVSVTVDDPNIKLLIEDRFPFILLNRRVLTRFVRKKTDYIVLDNVTGGHMAMEHLYKLGHRRIGIIAGGLRTSTASERTKGAKQLLTEYGVEWDPNLIVECHSSQDLAYHATKRLLSMKKPPTAIFAQDDFKALGVREAILKLGLRIPEDVALVGFDDIDLAALQGIELTTVSQKKYEMGSLAVKNLIDKIEKGALPMLNQVILEPELVIRRSCGYHLYGYQSEKGVGLASKTEFGP